MEDIIQMLGRMYANNNGAYRMLVFLDAEAVYAVTFVVFMFAPGSNDSVFWKR